MNNGKKLYVCITDKERCLVGKKSTNPKFFGGKVVSGGSLYNAGKTVLPGGRDSTSTNYKDRASKEFKDETGENLPKVEPFESDKKKLYVAFTYEVESDVLDKMVKDINQRIEKDNNATANKTVGQIVETERKDDELSCVEAIGIKTFIEECEKDESNRGWFAEIAKAIW